MARRLPWLPILALGTLALVWGTNWVVMKVALRYADPLTFAAIRAVSGGLSLLLVLLALRRDVHPGSWWGVLGLGVLQTTLFLGLGVTALEIGGAGRTAVLVYTMPLWLLLLAWPVLGERVRGTQWIAVALAALGLVFLLHPWSSHPHPVSVALAVLAGATWAVASLYVTKLRERVDAGILPLTAWQLLLGGLPILAFVLVRGPGPVAWTPTFLGAVAFNALPATAVAWFLWLYALQELPAGVAGMGTLLTPLVGVAVAWLVLGEVPTGWEGLGMASILGGLGVLAWTRLRRAGGEDQPRGEADQASGSSSEPSP